MNVRNRVTLGFVVGAAALMMGGEAVAQDALIVVIDRSGSMTGQGSVDGTSKWDIAIERARTEITATAADRAYELWTFSGTTWTRHYSFATGAGKTTAVRQAEMEAELDALPGPSSTTPLAGTVCDAVDSLTTWANGVGGFPPPLLRISLQSDGLENATNTTHPCYGPDSATAYDPTNPMRGGLTPNSWEWKVLNKAITGNENNPNNTPVTVIVDTAVLFDFIPTLAFAGPTIMQATSERTVTGAVVPGTFNGLGSGVSFFEGLANETGGRYVEVDPDLPPPVFADISGNGCVDNADYFALLAVYGQQVDATNIESDLNRNQVVDYADYLLLLNNFGLGYACP